jgi:hypothetical protein
VLARLSPEQCNAKNQRPTSPLPAATLSTINALANAAGLQHVGQLPLQCWHVFSPAATLDQTEAAVQALLQPDASILMASLNSTGGEVVVENVFAQMQHCYSQKHTVMGFWGFWGTCRLSHGGGSGCSSSMT